MSEVDPKYEPAIKWCIENWLEKTKAGCPSIEVTPEFEQSLRDNMRLMVINGDLESIYQEHKAFLQAQRGGTGRGQNEVSR